MKKKSVCKFWKSQFWHAQDSYEMAEMQNTDLKKKDGEKGKK